MPVATSKARHVVMGALYYALNYCSFKEAVIAAANNLGDADSVAALTGTFKALETGRIPEEYITNLEDAGYLAAQAEGLIIKPENVSRLLEEECCEEKLSSWLKEKGFTKKEESAFRGGWRILYSNGRGKEIRIYSGKQIYIVYPKDMQAIEEQFTSR